MEGKNGGKGSPPIIEGDMDVGRTANKFARYFHAICAPNSVERATELHAEFLSRKQEYVKEDSVSPYLLTVEKVDLAIRGLGLGKSAGADCLSPEHVRYAHPVLVSILTKLYNCMIVFGYVPDAFGRGVIVPILKANKPASKIESYRGISLNTVFSKVFEDCLLKTLSTYLTTSPLQFGFKARTGCCKAIYTVRRVVEHFSNQGSTVNLCTIDLEKAFDRLNTNALFIKLMDRRCPFFLLDFLSVGTLKLKRW